MWFVQATEGPAEIVSRFPGGSCVTSARARKLVSLAVRGDRVRRCGTEAQTGSLWTPVARPRAAFRRGNETVRQLGRPKQFGHRLLASGQ